MKWDSYVRAALGADLLDECASAYEPAFEHHRTLLRRLLRDLTPRRVAVLGAGYLNDLPFAEMLEGSRELYLVDWIPGISAEGVRSRIVQREGDAFRCLACSERHGGSALCGGFREPVADGVCSNFDTTPTRRLRCASYMPGRQPRFVIEDVTRGRARAFARRLDAIVAASTTPTAAFRSAIREAARIARVNFDLPIESRSIDLVVSSMVISQFDNEPWRYFSLNLEERFGRDRLRAEERQLHPLAEQLRTVLFQMQIDGHAREISRLLTTDGRAFVSLELFRSLPDSEHAFFAVDFVPAVIDVLSQRFAFEFEHLHVEDVLHEIAMGDARSVVQSYVLAPALETA
jgi:hypothetical protein